MTKLRARKALNKLSVRQQHRFRIDVKNLRYACDFFGGLFEYNKSNERRVRRFAHQIEILQDRLGRLHDLQMLKWQPSGARSAVLYESFQQRKTVTGLLNDAQVARSRLLDKRRFWA